MNKICVLGSACINESALNVLQAYGDVCVIKEIPSSEQELIKKLEGATVIVSALVELSGSVISSLPSLKLISLATTGFDDIDLDAAIRNNITVCYAPGYATQAVAEHTFALLLAAARNICTARDDVRAGLFDSCAYRGFELKDKQIGIVGFGAIGKRVADIARHGFGMKVSVIDVATTAQEKHAIFASSDVISLHLPLTKETHHLISHEMLSLMKDGVVIINTSRGKIIDEAALLAHIKSGKVRAAGLDVLENEPPSMHSELLSLSNVVVTPHIAYNTNEAVDERSKIVVENVRRFFASEPQNVVCMGRGL
jgi:phosphoglycerate dehydrogenase-like enzyme